MLSTKACSTHSFVNKNKGFTLIEVVVALVIVAVALPALLTLVSRQSDNTFQLRERTLAEWVAHDQLQTFRINHQLTGRILDGRQTGSTEFAGVSWHWVAESQDTAVEDMIRINIAVAADENDLRDYPTATLSAFIYK